jgi:hypothetical protein
MCQVYFPGKRGKGVRSPQHYKDEFPGCGLKRWRDVPVFLRILDIARRTIVKIDLKSPRSVYRHGRLRAIQFNLMIQPGADFEFIGQQWFQIYFPT